MTYSDDNVLPRPVEALPEYAHARSRQSLAEKLRAAFRLSEDAAATISNAVVDPTEVRKTIGEPLDPGVERIREYVRRQHLRIPRNGPEPSGGS
jgi:hypothetical protein